MPAKANSKPGPKRGRRPSVSKSPASPRRPNDPKTMAMYLAMAVRNAMEDFHCQHLSDAQMRELNPIIRNALYTALIAYGSEKPTAQFYVDFQMKMIPDYWEAPELEKEYVDMERHLGAMTGLSAEIEQGDDED